ncbi:uncharacterized protein SPAPADRAFT_51111 [Spathaspora passalidarum NRRL Y-27907]|uniref:C2H2-type domain-containing protein n=1 Tax=Spathaspora passalidarum (strain NRRL Y-27907 / 11-Y1) TaxID=619300 RepID=G3ANN8_SPAPN|nr:uncharacterized protein SPAPADRAFT_51111 [Spathaspora passalidarum NRRL Y-27907]EGW32567.1 hypothetical protein SPAPADRAFT_51111 [Spathaspora passalidarum NRRL Y-27907]
MGFELPGDRSRIFEGSSQSQPRPELEPSSSPRPTLPPIQQLTSGYPIAPIYAVLDGTPSNETSQPSGNVHSCESTPVPTGHTPEASISDATKPSLPKKYFCKICKQGFTRKHNMVSHELIHSSLKPHICAVCNLKFRRIHDLKRHEKLHMGEKPYACDRCSRRFARADALTRHQNSVNACSGSLSKGKRHLVDGQASRYVDGKDIDGSARSGGDYIQEPNNKSTSPVITPIHGASSVSLMNGESSSIHLSNQGTTFHHSREEEGKPQLPHYHQPPNQLPVPNNISYPSGSGHSLPVQHVAGPIPMHPSQYYNPPIYNSYTIPQMNNSGQINSAPFMNSGPHMNNVPHINNVSHMNNISHMNNLPHLNNVPHMNNVVQGDGSPMNNVILSGRPISPTMQSDHPGSPGVTFPHKHQLPIQSHVQPGTVTRVLSLPPPSQLAVIPSPTHPSQFFNASQQHQHMNGFIPSQPVHSGSQSQSQSHPGDSANLAVGESEVRDGVYIPYSRYQDLVSHAQTLQDELFRMNNRISHLEKDTKDNPK